MGRLSSLVASPALTHAAHGIFMNAEQIGDFFHRVVAVDFHESVVWMSFSHLSPKQ